jgi:hypothetical protein
MKQWWLIFLILFVYIGNIQAQQDYRKGYIITGQQDTIYGWVDYRGDVRNAKICLFKKTETGQATEYSPSDIAAYRFMNGKFYVSKNIGNADTPKQVFLEYLVNGMAKLYYYCEEGNKEYYYIEKDELFHELKCYVKEEVIDDKTFKKTMKP